MIYYALEYHIISYIISHYLEFLSHESSPFTTIYTSLFYSVCYPPPNPGFRAHRLLLGGPGPESPYHSRGTYTPVLTFVSNSVCAIIWYCASRHLANYLRPILPPSPFFPLLLFVPLLPSHFFFLSFHLRYEIETQFSIKRIILLP